MFFVIGFMVGPLLGTVFLDGLDITYRVLFQITAFILGYCNNYLNSSLKKKSKKPSRKDSLFHQSKK